MPLPQGEFASLTQFRKISRRRELPALAQNTAPKHDIQWRFVESVPKLPSPRCVRSPPEAPILEAPLFENGDEVHSTKGKANKEHWNELWPNAATPQPKKSANPHPPSEVPNRRVQFASSNPPGNPQVDLHSFSSSQGSLRRGTIRANHREKLQTLKAVLADTVHDLTNNAIIFPRGDKSAAANSQRNALKSILEGLEVEPLRKEYLVRHPLENAQEWEYSPRE